MFPDSVGHGMLIATLIFIVQGRIAHSYEYGLARYSVRASPVGRRLTVPHLRPEQPRRSTGMDLQLQHQPKPKVA